MYTIVMTPKMREFARLYCLNPNAEAAAIGAGYSKQYAKSKSTYLVRHEDVVAEIQRLRQRTNERAEKSSVDVVNAYANIAFNDRWGFIKPDPDFPDEHIFKAPYELTDEQRAVIVDMKPRWHKRERTVDGVKKEVHREEWIYKFADKESALQQMGRHFGIFDDKLKLTTSRQNPFKNATPQQLAKLKESFIKTMNIPSLIEGEYTEVKQ